jgi:hypothetical protein
MLWVFRSCPDAVEFSVLIFEALFSVIFTAGMRLSLERYREISRLGPVAVAKWIGIFAPVDKNAAIGSR